MVKLDVFNPRKTIGFSVIVILLGIFEVCWGIRTPVRAQDARSNETLEQKLEQDYWNAVEDARVAKPDEIFRNLTAITPDNKTLTWDKGRVLVAAWKRPVEDYKSGNSINKLNADLWVTPVPELQKFCQQYTPTQNISLARRLNQLLGLPLDKSHNNSPSSERQVVEFWVDPKFLFRPSPDPEITDSEAELRFRDTNKFISVSPDYKKWFTWQFTQSYEYKNEKGKVTFITRSTNRVAYPWTRLGYTYDWGNSSDWAKIDTNRPKYVGLSEFVIPQGSPVSVQSVQSAQAYCRQS